MNRLAVSAVLGAAMLAAAPVLAQDYPDRPITLIAPFAPGASADGIARLIGKDLSATLGQPVVVENRPGGGGAVGLMTVANAAKDGYTLGLGATGAIAVNPHLPDSSPLKPQQDLAPVAKLADIPLVMIAARNAGYPDLKTLLEKGKSQKEGIAYGTPGQYTSQHLSGALVGQMTGIRLTAVPYRGSAPAVTDVLGGQIPLAVVDLTSAYPHIQTGALVGLGVTSGQRATAAPDLPTLAEAGIPGYEAPAWMGLFAPAGVPPEVLEKISDAVRQALDKPEVQQQIVNLAAEPAYANGPDFGRFIDAESQRWGRLVKAMPASNN